MSNLRNQLIVIIISILIGIAVGWRIFKRSSKPTVVIQEKKIENKRLQDSLQAIISHLKVENDSLYHIKQKVLLKQTILTEKRHEKDSIILSTPDSNIVRLFTRLSKDLNSKASR